MKKGGKMRNQEENEMVEVSTVQAIREFIFIGVIGFIFSVYL